MYIAVRDEIRNILLTSAAQSKRQMPMEIGMMSVKGKDKGSKGQGKKGEGKKSGKGSHKGKEKEVHQGKGIANDAEERCFYCGKKGHRRNK